MIDTFCGDNLSRKSDKGIEKGQSLRNLQLN
jgi:hypothetical protein